MKISLLDQEKFVARWVSILLGALALTGFTTYFATDFGVAEQAIVLAHIAAGVVLSLLVLPYLVIHFRRTLGFRRPGALTSGIITAATLLTLSGTGIDLLYFGSQEAKAWVYQIHTYGAYLIVALVAMHLWIHLKWFPERRRNTSEARFATLQKMSGVSTTMVLSLGALVSLVIAADASLTPEFSTAPAVTPYATNYGPHPFRPSHTETLSGKFVDKRLIAGSSECGSCHQAVFEQWSASVHRQAASDRTYVSNVMLLEKNKGIEATRYCEGCHAPIAMLSGELSLGGKHGGIEGTAANLEGVSCLSCHRINRIVHTKGVASYEYAPASGYLFTAAEQPLLKQINHLLIRTLPQQHKADMAMSHTKDPALCSTCHAQFMDVEMNNWGWVKMQDDYTAWLASPYSGQSEQRFAHAEVTRCQDCHMPLLEAADPSADQEGKVRSHFMLGANTMLSTLSGDTAQTERLKKFLQADRMRIAFDIPHREDATQNRMAIDESLRKHALQPSYFYKGESATLKLVVSNVGIGHDFPGGTIDLNEAWIEFLAQDAEGNTIYHSGAMDEYGNVDENAYYYRSLPIDRKGQLVWRHDLFNQVGEVARNVVKAGKSDVVDFSFRVPDWAKGPLQVSAVLRYRKLNERYARWAMAGDYVPIPVIDMARAHISLPVRDQKEILSAAAAN